MARLRNSLAALALIGGILAATGAAAFAQELHSVCAAKQHDCGTAAKISNCCCGDLGAPRPDTTPAQPRVEIQTGLSATPAVPALVHVTPTARPVRTVQTSPPRLCLLDLPTLFSVFLI